MSGKYSLNTFGNIVKCDYIRSNIGIGVSPVIYTRLKVNSLGSGQDNSLWISSLFGGYNDALNKVALGTINSNACVAAIDNLYNWTDLYLNSDTISGGNYGNVIIQGNFINSNSTYIQSNLNIFGNIGIGKNATNIKLDINANNDGSGTNNWVYTSIGSSNNAINRVVLGVINSNASIGSFNYSTNKWGQLLLNGDGNGKGENVTVATNLIVNSNIFISSNTYIGSTNLTGRQLNIYGNISVIGSDTNNGIIKSTNGILLTGGNISLTSTGGLIIYGGTGANISGTINSFTSTSTNTISGVTNYITASDINNFSAVTNNFSGNLLILSTSTLTVGGLITANNGLIVRGGINVTGNSIITGDLNVTGAIQYNSAITTNTGLVVTCANGVTGLTVAPNGSVFTGSLKTDEIISSGLITCKNGLTISGGIITLGSSINTTGLTVTNDGLEVTRGGANISGGINVYGGASITGGANISGGAIVGGVLYCQDDIFVTGKIITNGGILGTGAGGTGSNIDVVGMVKAGSGAYISGTTYLNGTTNIMGSNLGCTLNVTGTIGATSDIGVLSDERLKTDIRTIDNALEKVNKLRGVYFKRNKLFNDNEDTDRINIGVIAQEIEKIFPEAILINNDSEEKYRSVIYQNLVGVLIEAIKEMDIKYTKKIEELNNKLNEFIIDQ